MKQNADRILTNIILNVVLIVFSMNIIELIPMLLITLRWNSLTEYKELSMGTPAPTTIFFILVVGAIIKLIVDFVSKRLFER